MVESYSYDDDFGELVSKVLMGLEVIHIVKVLKLEVQ